jgi:hypothetical protein
VAQICFVGVPTIAAGCLPMVSALLAKTRLSLGQGGSTQRKDCSERKDCSVLTLSCMRNRKGRRY